MAGWRYIGFRKILLALVETRVKSQYEARAREFYGVLQHQLSNP